MFKLVYGRALAILKQKPMRLWGLSLLGTLLVALAWILGVLPIISIPLVAALSFGMICVYIAGYKGEEFSTEQLFTAFMDGRFKNIVFGILWMELWVFLWSLIPIVGVVFGIIKAYTYRFVPYLLKDEPELSPKAALQKSKEMTAGYRGKMFGCDLALIGLFYAAVIVLGLLALIPYVGVVFTIITVLLGLVFGIVAPLMYGLLGAGYYIEVSSGNAASFAAAQAQAKYAPPPQYNQQPQYGQQPYQQQPYQQPQYGQQAYQPQYSAPVDNQTATFVPPVVAPVTDAPAAEEAPAAAAVCPNCGTPADGMFCAKCGTKLK